MIDLEKLKKAREVTTQGGVIRGRKGTLNAMAPDLADAVIELAEALRLFVDYDQSEGDGVQDMIAYADAIEAARAALAKHIKGERT